MRERKINLQVIKSYIYLYGEQCRSSGGSRFAGNGCMHKCFAVFYQQKRTIGALRVSTNIMGAERELKEAFANLNQDRIQGVLSQAGVRWRFNPPACSHHVGVREQMRRVLSSVLCQQSLDDV